MLNKIENNNYRLDHVLAVKDGVITTTHKKTYFSGEMVAIIDPINMDTINYGQIYNCDNSKNKIVFK
jgi:hypothetical protein